MQNTVKLKSDLGNFTLFHNEFIDNELLTYAEKLVFIAIKRHLNNKSYSAYPSMNTISKKVGISKPTVVKAVKGLEDKKIIQVVRERENNTKNKNNVYIIYDSKEIWSTNTVEEMREKAEEVSENKANLDKVTEEDLLKLAEKFGYTISKADDNKKEFESTSKTTTENEVISNSNKKSYYYNNIKDNEECQEVCGSNIPDNTEHTYNDSDIEQLANLLECKFDEDKMIYIKSILIDKGFNSEEKQHNVLQKLYARMKTYEVQNGKEYSYFIKMLEGYSEQQTIAQTTTKYDRVRNFSTYSDQREFDPDADAERQQQLLEEIWGEGKDAE